MNTRLNPWFRFTRIAAAVLGVALLSACAMPKYDAPAPGEPRTVVVWISLDGVRGDYFERADTPFFDKMMNEGAYSLAHAPIFPSITFPNHVAQATGVTVDRHGIPLNSFYDKKYDRKYNYPGLPFLLEAEPIWTTATRQGRRVAVYDWVLSHQQSGEHAADYYGERYDSSLEDKDRIRALLTTWRKDRAREPLNLLMGYMVTPDKVGHEFGPDAPEIADGMRKVDNHMAWFTKQAIRIFDKRMTPDDTFYLLVTSDHGMSRIHTVVHPTRLTGVTWAEDSEDRIITMTTGNLAHIFLHNISDAEERAARQAAILERLAEYDFVDVYAREELPAQWQYAHPTRVGDLVLVLHTGYAFSRRTPGVTATPEEADSALGMHGYDPATNPEMNGIALIWRYPEPIGGVDLGKTHSLQLHATVAEWLGIKPAKGARSDALSF